ncbi:MAG: helix-turn-helix domain-containing protein, partial [Bacteroidota bacterium]
MPLLFLVVQGYLFAILLLNRYRNQRHLSDVFLALLLIITAYQCTSYTIGFMDWYDTFRNTKINYYLIDVTLAIGPTLLFYILMVTQPNRGFRKRDWWHYVPFLVWTVYEIFVWAYDSSQAGYWDTQNGWWLENVHFPYVSPFQEGLGYLSKIIYFTFSIQLFWQYQQRVRAFYSNTYKAELSWIRNFLIIYCILLFSVTTVMSMVNEFIIPLHWQQSWWAFLATALTAYYLGMSGYFKDLSKLLSITEKTERKEKIITPQPSAKVDDSVLEWKYKLEQLMVEEKPYLDPDLTLSQLAKKTGLPTNQLSHVINSGFGKNFNDFVNSYRVEEIKRRLEAGEQKSKSFLGIALDCGHRSPDGARG